MSLKDKIITIDADEFTIRYALVVNKIIGDANETERSTLILMFSLFGDTLMRELFDNYAKEVN